MPDANALRRALSEASDSDLLYLATSVQDALGGDSNDGEHDALAEVADFFGIRWSSYEDREDDEDE